MAWTREVIVRVVVIGSAVVLGLLVLGAAAYLLADRGPASYTARYRRAVEARLRAGARAADEFITDADLAALPDPVARYLRAAAVVGQPRVRAFRVVMEGRIRGGPDQPWMPFTAEQHDFVDEPARFFHMRARRAGLPVDVYHAYDDGAARMGARLLSLVRVMDAAGPDLTRAETVTLFNDLALFAPGALLHPSIRWEPVDDHSVRGHYTVGDHTVSALLSFDDAGALVDFASDDRLLASADGGVLTPVRWSTPLSGHRDFGPYRLAARGEGVWHSAGGAWTYFEGEILDVEVNPGR